MTKNPIVVLKHLEGSAYGPVIEETLKQVGFFQTVPSANSSNSPDIALSKP